MKIKRQIKTVFSVDKIGKAVKQLNTKKAGNSDELKIEHIIHAHPNIHCHIKKLFNLKIQHGHAPVDFKLGVNTPVKKIKERIMRKLVITDLFQ